MTSPVIQYKRLRAPKGHGGVLLDPSLDVYADRVRHNERARQSFGETRIAELEIGKIAAVVRDEAVAKAIAWTERYRSVEFADGLSSQNTILMAGHQPTIFHPGVWFKNFVLSAQGQEIGDAIPINFIVDNDLASSASIRVPTGSPRNPVIANVAFDNAADPMPFEQREIQSRDQVLSFAERVSQVIHPFVTDPIVSQAWSHAKATLEMTKILGEFTAILRHRFEEALGLATLEVPWSQVCDTEGFWRLLFHVSSHADSFRDTHNRLLVEYRKVNRVRSSAHPVPDLTSEDGWVEIPFWIWSDDKPQRRRLFATVREHHITLSDRDSLTIELDSDAANAMEQLSGARDHGIKIRSRALTTTIFSRLFLSDFFIHGIGGAKYDQLTDAIIQQFFGLTAPHFATVTATTQIVQKDTEQTVAKLRQTNKTLRDLEFNPDRHISAENSGKLDETPIGEWVARKHSSLTQTGSNLPAAERHRIITQVNHVLQPLVAEQRANLLERRETLDQQLRIERLITSREFSFCLHSAKTLPALLLELCAAGP